MNRLLGIAVAFTSLALGVVPAKADEAAPSGKKIKVFIMAGQSNMVGWGNSTKLPNDWRKGNDRVLMFENDQWQPLRPHEPAMENQKRFGLTEFHFGPEIAFGHELASAFPDETIGIIKYASGGSSILAWKPDWRKEDADRIGQGGRGSLYKSMIDKVKRALSTFAGVIWAYTISRHALASGFCEPWASAQRLINLQNP